MVLLFGCSMEKGENDSTSTKELYHGEPLEVGVVGSTKLPNIKYIKYEYTQLKDIHENNRVFDVLLITQEAFKEADKSEYIDFYNSVNYPVFSLA